MQGLYNVSFFIARLDLIAAWLRALVTTPITLRLFEGSNPAIRLSRLRGNQTLENARHANASHTSMPQHTIRSDNSCSYNVSALLLPSQLPIAVDLFR